MPRTQGVNAQRNQRIAEQQAVLDQLRSGGSVNLYSSNPFVAGIERLGNIFAGTTQPTAKAGKLSSGREALIVPGGWGAGQKPSSNLPQEVIVGGQRWFLGQQGQNAAYTRAAGNVGGQYGSIFSADQLASPAEPASQPPAPASQPPAPIDPYAAQNRAYQQERARVEAMVKSNPDMQKQEIADARAKVRDQGMAIWAAKYGGQGGLAERVKPGQVGYDAVQQALLGNEAGEAMRQGYGFQMPQQVTMTPPPGVNIPQGLPAVNSFSPGDMYGQEGIDFDPELRKKFQSLLNAAQAK